MNHRCTPCVMKGEGKKLKLRCGWRPCGENDLAAIDRLRMAHMEDSSRHNRIARKPPGSLLEDAFGHPVPTGAA
jgi:hypothetical protein